MVGGPGHGSEPLLNSIWGNHADACTKNLPKFSFSYLDCYSLRLVVGQF